MRRMTIALVLLAAAPAQGQDVFTMTVAEYVALEEADQSILAGYLIGLYQLSSEPMAREAKSCVEEWVERADGDGVKYLGNWMRDAVLLGFRVESGSDLVATVLVAALLETCR